MRLSAPLAATLVVATLFAASPSHAQDRVPVERRVDTLEKQMRSVQRRVFAPGTTPAVDANDVATPTPVAANTGAIADLAARVDALERSLRTITGQVEENGDRVRRLEEEVRRARDADDARLWPPATAGLEVGAGFLGGPGHHPGTEGEELAALRAPVDEEG